MIIGIEIIIIFLPLSHLIWGRRNTSSSFTLLYLPSWHHPLLSLTYHSLHRPYIFSLAFLFLSIHPHIPITLIVTCVSSLLITCPFQDRRFPLFFSVTGVTFKLPLIYYNIIKIVYLHYWLFVYYVVFVYTLFMIEASI